MWDLSAWPDAERPEVHRRLDLHARTVAVRPKLGQKLSEALPAAAADTWGGGHVVRPMAAHVLNVSGLAAVALTPEAFPLRAAFALLEAASSRFLAATGESWRAERSDVPLGDAIVTEVAAQSGPSAEPAALRTSTLGLPTHAQPPAIAAAPPAAVPPAARAPHDPHGGPVAAAPDPADVRELMGCARHGRYKEAKALLKSASMAAADGTYGIDTRDSYGNTALMVACQNGQNKVAKMCLRYGAGVNAQNGRGNSALHFAVAYGFGPLAEWLQRAGADRTLRNVAGRMALEGIGPEGDV